MRRITTGLFVSLDGVVDADDDWQFRYFDDEFVEWISAGGERVETVLIGRRSFAGYDALRSAHPDSPVLPFLRRVERYVLSTTLETTDWPGTRILGRDAFARIRELKEGSGGDISVVGSPSVVRGLLAHGLLDELGLCVMPMLVGPGPRLFPDGDVELSRLGLVLDHVERFRSGVVALTYRPEGGSGA